MSEVRKVLPSEFPRIAVWIERMNRSPETHCLHSSSGERAEELVAEMESLHRTGELIWTVVVGGEEMRGLIGCEFERDGHRGWMRGPFSSGASADDLDRGWFQLQGLLPPSIHRLDTFLNIKNREGQEFYRRHGFERQGESHEYLAVRPPEMAPAGIEHCVPLPVEHQRVFASLHDRIFPQTYYNGAQIVHRLDEDHCVWVYLDSGQVLGYIHLAAEPWADEGFVEYLGVEDDFRGRGIGSALLHRALDWGFNQRGLAALGLVVADGNTNARSMYERCGFALKHTGVNQRLERPNA